MNELEMLPSRRPSHTVGTSYKVSVSLVNAATKLLYLRKLWLLISLIRILIIFLSDKMQHSNRFLLYYSLSIPWETRARGDSAFIEAGMAALQTWRISASSFQTNILSTGRLDRMSGRKWRETKQSQVTRSGHQISCCSVSLHFLWDILSTGPV